MVKVPTNPDVYHITHVENLETIIKNKGIFSKNKADSMNIPYKDISYPGAQSTRHNTTIPFPPKGTMHDYVPFYFTNRSPMLGAIDHNEGKTEGYNEGQKPIIYLVSRYGNFVTDPPSHAFTEKHANHDPSFYNEEWMLECVDWSLIFNWKWQNKEEQIRKMAEFLVFEFVKIESISLIGVINEEMKDIVENTLNEGQIDIPVEIKQNWYFGFPYVRG